MKRETQNTFLNGLQTDLNSLITPNDILTDAINATFITSNGSEYILQNESGNIKIYEKESNSEVKLSPGYIPIGIKEYGGILYIISIKQYEENKYYTEIGTYPSPLYKYSNGQDIRPYINNLSILEYNYKPINVLINDNDPIIKDKEIVYPFTNVDINISPNHPLSLEIQPTYDDSINIIFTDDINYPRLVNSGFAVINNTTCTFPDRKGGGDTNRYNINNLENELKLYKISETIPRLEFINCLPGGVLPCGNYTFYFTLSDADGNETEFVQESSNVSIYIGTNGQIDTIRGGMLNEVSDKCVNFKLSNLDKSFKFINVYYSISTSGYDGIEIKNHFKINQKFLIPELYQSSDFIEIIITGLEVKEELTESEINISRPVYSKAKAQAQNQGRLFLANVESEGYEDIFSELEKLSLNVFPIASFGNEVTKQTLDESTKEFKYDYDQSSFEGGYYNTRNIYYNVGYWETEIYRFAIRYILPDGTISPPFNIRGKDSVTNLPFDQQYSIFKENGQFIDLLPEYNESTGFVLDTDTSENVKGVITFYTEDSILKNGDYKFTPLALQISIPDIIQEKLKKLTKGFYIVRQKRIPSILAQGVTIATITPELYTTLEDKYYLELELDTTPNDVYPTNKCDNYVTTYVKWRCFLILPDGTTQEVDTMPDTVPEIQVSRQVRYHIVGGRDFTANATAILKIDKNETNKTVQTETRMTGSRWVVSLCQVDVSDTRNDNRSKVMEIIYPINDFRGSNGTYFTMNPTNIQSLSGNVPMIPILPNTYSLHALGGFAAGYITESFIKGTLISGIYRELLGKEILSHDYITRTLSFFKISTFLDKKNIAESRRASFNIRGRMEVEESEGNWKSIDYYTGRDSYILHNALLCPEAELRSYQFNQIFNGSNFVIEQAPYQPNNVAFEQNSKYDRVYSLPKLIDKFLGTRYIKANLISIQDGLKSASCGQYIFATKCGSEVNSYDNMKLTKGVSSLLDRAKHEIDIVRGNYGPYIGSDSTISFYEQEPPFKRITPIVNIRIPNWYNISTENHFSVRIFDNESFYAITHWMQWDDPDISYSNNTYNIDKIQRGDCFICDYSHRMNRNFMDPETGPYDIIQDYYNWQNGYTVTPTSEGGQINIEESQSKLNRADVNAIALGHWATFPIMSSYNLCLRPLDYSYPSEQAITGVPRGFSPFNKFPVSGSFKIPESNVFNTGYSGLSSGRLGFVIDDLLFTKSNFNTRIAYSNKYLTDQFANGYRTFSLGNYRDYTKEYGAITALESLGSNLICVFQHGIALIPVNERAVAADGPGGYAHINTDIILPEHPLIISSNFGSIFKESILKSTNWIYGVDTVAKMIWRTNGQEFQSLTDQKFQKFLNKHLIIDETDEVVEVTWKNIKTHYNEYKGEVLFTFYDEDYLNPENCNYTGRKWSLCYNERIDRFVTFFTWMPLYSENINNSFITFDQNKAKEIINSINSEESLNIWKHGKLDLPFSKGKPKITNWYDVQHPFEFEFTVNDLVGVQKIFDNLVIVSNKAEPESLHFEISADNYIERYDLSKTYYKTCNDNKNISDDYDRFNREYTYEDYTGAYPYGKQPFNVNGSEIISSEDNQDIQENTIFIHQQVRPIDKTDENGRFYGRLRGNAYYKENEWYHEIRPLVYINKDNNQRIETRIRDKYIKIRVRYSGEKLAIIHSLRTLFTISQS